MGNPLFKIIQVVKNKTLTRFRRLRLIFDKNKIDKQLEVLELEVVKIHHILDALREIIKQSKDCFIVYKKYHTFFSYTYYAFYNEVLHGIHRLHDTSRDSLSIVKILITLSGLDDNFSEDEKIILDKIKTHSLNKKINTLRNKLGRAHLDGKASLNKNKQNVVFEKSKVSLYEIEEYLELLQKGIETASYRLEQPRWLNRSRSEINLEIRQIFKVLASDEESKDEE